MSKNIEQKWKFFIINSFFLFVCLTNNKGIVKKYSKNFIWILLKVEEEICSDKRTISVHIEVGQLLNVFANEHNGQCIRVSSISIHLSIFAYESLIIANIETDKWINMSTRWRWRTFEYIGLTQRQHNLNMCLQLFCYSIVFQLINI